MIIMGVIRLNVNFASAALMNRKSTADPMQIAVGDDEVMGQLLRPVMIDIIIARATLGVLWTASKYVSSQEL